MSGGPPEGTDPRPTDEPAGASDTSADEDGVDEESEESFPASDAPQHWAGPAER
jgi:hypothetical protein